MTANALEGDRQTCLDAGMDDYLSKPYSVTQLEAVLSRWLPAGTGKTQARTAPASVASVLDESLLQQLRDIGGGDGGGNDSLLQQVLQVYLDTTPDLVAQLEQAVLANDAEGLRRLAHSLKSSSGNVGAKTLAALFRQLEVLGKEQRTEEAKAMMAELGTCYEHAMDALRSLLLKETAA
jgi:HPt (histidine-containing phosphotransfer) domain-containing protein